MNLMKAAKENFPTNLLIAFVFGILIGYVVYTYSGGVGGRAFFAVTPETIQSELQEALPKLSFLKDMNEADACIIVHIDATTAYSFEIIKGRTTFVVKQSQDYFCRGADVEDFIFSYVSYDKLKEHLTALPDFQTFRKTSDGTNFYVLPSRQIVPGLKIANPQEFQRRFGPFMQTYFSQEEVQRFIGTV